MENYSQWSIEFDSDQLIHCFRFEATSLFGLDEILQGVKCFFNRLNINGFLHCRIWFKIDLLMSLKYLQLTIILKSLSTSAEEVPRTKIVLINPVSSEPISKTSENSMKILDFRYLVIR